MNNPTTEQHDAVDKFKAQKNLKVNAFAGTGKTSTLQMMAQESPRRGLYIAFNKSIADEASKRFPQNVNCRTTHSLAFQATPRAFKQSKGKMVDRILGNQAAEILGLKSLVFRKIDFTLNKRSVGHLVCETVRQFAYSPDQTISRSHVPDYGRLAQLHGTARQQVQALIVDKAKTLWNRMTDPKDSVPLGHDGYLKLWALSRPRLAADFVLLDEAQDTNPVVLGLLHGQKAQIVYVGDRHQQIYEWRGAVNAMESAKTPHIAYLTKSFRFGQQIATAASQVLSHLGEEKQLVGNEEKPGYIGCSNPRTILSRTNASVLTTVISRQQAGQSVHVVGGAKDYIRLLEGVSRLKQDMPSDIPEFFGFANWRQVVAFSETTEGEHLKTFVKLVERHGEQELIRSLERTVSSEREADVVASTAHKAKGREWETVGLTADFVPSRMDKEGKPLPPDPAEIRLFYVAATRGKLAIDIDPALCEQFSIARNPLNDAPPRAKPQLATPRVTAAQTKGTQRPTTHSGSGISGSAIFWGAVVMIVLYLWMFS